MRPFDGTIPDSKILDMLDYAYDYVVTDLKKAEHDPLASH